MNEFFVPLNGTDFCSYLDSDISALHHLSRYEWARRVLTELKPDRILDIACGAGYGSHMIAGALPGSKVVGCDYDPASQEYAQQHYQADNLEYVTGSMVTWDSEGSSLGTFDAIVSFDTIEHVDHREIALLKMARNLSDGGCLLFSTPSSHEQNLLNPPWEHHKIEYCYRDLMDLMSRFFHEVSSPLTDGFPHQNFWRNEVNGSKTRYPNLGNPLFCRGPIK